MKNQDLILLDLFSGMGGFHLGLEEAGFNFKKVYFSEVDKHAIANYKYNFNEAEYIGSVEHILDSGIERPNIGTFGSPCQDFSLAGKRKGLDGDRSSLIEYALSAVAHFRPDIYIWENVKGTFSSNAGEDFWAIIQAFANIGGYELEWQLVNTSWILPQNRERIYLVGHLTESFRNWQGVFPIEEDDETIGKKNRANRDRIQAENSSTITSGYGTKGYETYIQCKNIAGCLTGGGHSGGLRSDMDIVVHSSIDLKSVKSSTRGGMFKENQTHTLDTDCYLGVSESESIRRLTEIECERLQGFPDDWTKWGFYDGQVKQISKTQRYKMCGNAVTAKMVELIGKRIKRNFKNPSSIIKL